jgi:hypothetical protein
MFLRRGLGFYRKEHMYYTDDVKLVAKVKIVPTREQRQLLKDTLYQANQAANEVSGVAVGGNVFSSIRHLQAGV